MKYNNLNEDQKMKFLEEEYEKNKKSFKEIASFCETYANKLRRDALKYKIKIRDKSEAQKNALDSGKTIHPTKGKERSEKTKEKIGKSVLHSWQNLDGSELKIRQEKARVNWNNMSDQEKQNILKLANEAVRVSSKHGSKLEKHILEKLLRDGYQVEFHKEQTLANTKLQIDLFIPKMNVAIEVDGPSHFEPVWGEDALSRNRNYDNKKAGLILGKGLVLIRIKQAKDYSKSRSDMIYLELKNQLDNIEKQFPSVDNRTINIGDK